MSIITRVEGAFHFDVFAAPHGDRVLQVTDDQTGQVVQIVFGGQATEQFLIPWLQQPKVPLAVNGLVVPGV